VIGAAAGDLPPLPREDRPGPVEGAGEGELRGAVVPSLRGDAAVLAVRPSVHGTERRALFAAFGGLAAAYLALVVAFASTFVRGERGRLQGARALTALREVNQTVSSAESLGQVFVLASSRAAEILGGVHLCFLVRVRPEGLQP
jgi:hypothetical protein